MAASNETYALWRLLLVSRYWFSQKVALRLYQHSTCCLIEICGRGLAIYVLKVLMCGRRSIFAFAPNNWTNVLTFSLKLLPLYSLKSTLIHILICLYNFADHKVLVYQLFLAIIPLAVVVPRSVVIDLQNLPKFRLLTLNQLCFIQAVTNYIYCTFTNYQVAEGKSDTARLHWQITVSSVKYFSKLCSNHSDVRISAVTQLRELSSQLSELSSQLSDPNIQLRGPSALLAHNWEISVHNWVLHLKRRLICWLSVKWPIDQDNLCW